MKQRADNEKILTDYLLGDLPDEERERLEARYFVDDQSYQELRAAERDLMDRYVRNDLTATERERFESYFLSSGGRRERLAFARALAQVTATAPAPPPDAPPSACAARR